MSAPDKNDGDESLLNGNNNNNVNANGTSESSPLLLDGSTTAAEAAATTESVNVRKHSWALSAMCLCIFVDAFLMQSVFPYGGFMALHLLPSSLGVTKETVGRFAGFLSSSFMLGRMLTSYYWGAFSDAYGRKFAQQVSLVALIVLSLTFGLATSFPMACFIRFVMGGMDCAVVLSNTVAMEISHEVPVLERRSMALVVGIRSFGFLISPAVGGLLAQPLQQYPSWSESSLLAGWPLKMLQKYPFILPNIIGSILSMLAMALVHFCLDETLPEHRRRHHKHLPGDFKNFIIRTISEIGAKLQRCIRKVPANETVAAETNGKLDDDAGSVASITSPSGWGSYTIRYHLVTSWLFSIVPVFIDESFPLFAMSTSSGLALTSGEIGKILSGAGLIYILTQYGTYMCITQHLGVYSTLLLACMIATNLPGLIPVALIFGGSAVTYAMLSFLIGISKVNIAIFLSSINLAVNQTITKEQRARTNGLLAFGNASARAAGPLIAGWYVSFCYSAIFPFGAPYNSMFIWLAVPAVGIYLATRARYLKRLIESGGDGGLGANNGNTNSTTTMMNKEDESSVV